MSDLRSELRELRKTHPDYMSVSKMKVKDVALAIGKLRAHLESSPSIAHDGGKSKKAMKGTEKSVKDAKQAEFPSVPAGDHEAPKSAKKVAKKDKAPVEVEVPKAKGKAKAEAPKAEAPAAKKGKPAKGSEEMKAKMAAIRGKKGAKKAE
jgi:hypothetical protein